MNLALRFATRYLFAKKSHNVINIISSISALGMGIGAAALVIILSVYNGFNSLVTDSLGNVEPDILVTPAKGKVFVPDSEAFDWAYDNPDILNMCSVLEENVFINYDGQSGIVTAKGVDKVYEEESPLKDKITEGKFTLHKGQLPLAAVGSGVAYSMNISPRFVAGIEMYFPIRDGRISMANPYASLNFEKVFPSGIFAVNADIDSKLIIVPIETMRDLLDYEDEVSSVELRMVPGTTAKTLARTIRELEDRLGQDYVVKDRFMQNDALYKMMRYEKAAIFLILTFVIFIIAFSIFGSLSMLIIEKREDIETLRGLGAPDRMVDRIFILEGWMISTLGMVVGVVAGIAFVLLQQHFGFIRMPGNFLAASYPVILKWTDILISAVTISGIGLLMAIFPVKGIRTKA